MRWPVIADVADDCGSLVLAIESLVPLVSEGQQPALGWSLLRFPPAESASLRLVRIKTAWIKDIPPLRSSCNYLVLCALHAAGPGYA